MRNTNKLLMAGLLVVVGLANAGIATAQYRLNNGEMRNLIQRVETRTDSFSRNLENSLDRSSINGTSREDEINRLVQDFENATDQLKTRFESRQATATEARAVLDRAALIHQFLLVNRLDARVNQDWVLLRADLDRLASAFNLGWRWDTTVAGSTGGDLYTNTRTRQLAQALAVGANQFRRSFDQAVNRSRMGNSAEYQLRGRVGEFQLAATRFRDRLNRRQATANELQQLLQLAVPIDNLMRNNQLTRRAEGDWDTVRTDLTALANASNIAWNWENITPGGPIYGTAHLTGTYRIDSNSGDDPRTVAENATRNLPAQRRDRVYQNLLNRLSPPDVLAIDQRGQNVVIASSKAPQVSLVADGREQVETGQQGRTARVRVSLSGDQLIIGRTGDREQDFTVTFDPIDSNRLLVTRQLYTEQLGQQVTVRTYYTRTSDVAQLNIHNSNPQYPVPGNGTVSGDFIVPNGTQLVATLDTSLSTNNVSEGQRFTMTVRDGQYQGAVIEGRVTNVSRSGRVTGRSELALDFDSIRLRDGRTYRFAGILEGVRTTSGDVVRVDNEGAVRDSNQTTRTIQRSAIGAAVGAIIGAIAGGGQGAAIGAAVGAGAGAGSVYIQGREDLQLEPGTEVTIRATGPR